MSQIENLPVHQTRCMAKHPWNEMTWLALKRQIQHSIVHDFVLNESVKLFVQSLNLQTGPIRGGRRGRSYPGPGR